MAHGLAGAPQRDRLAERYRATVTARPLLFLDVDGPLLPFGGSPLPGSREMVASGHLARLRRDAGPRLAGLPCTRVWAPTWLEDANSALAPRLGLPDLPVVTWPEPTGDDEREDDASDEHPLPLPDSRVALAGMTVRTSRV